MEENHSLYNQAYIHTRSKEKLRPTEGTMSANYWTGRQHYNPLIFIPHHTPFFPQVVLTCLKQHWVTVRKHFAAVSRARTQQQQQQRLAPALDRALPNIPAQQPNSFAGKLPGL